MKGPTVRRLQTKRAVESETDENCSTLHDDVVGDVTRGTPPLACARSSARGCVRATTQRACSLLCTDQWLPLPHCQPAKAAVFESAPDACPTLARRCRPDAASTACVGLSMPKQLL